MSNTVRLRGRQRVSEALFIVPVYILFGVVTLLCVFPFYYLFINSISANDASTNGDVIFYPIGVHFSNYIEVMKLSRLMQSAFISVARTVLGTLATLLGSTLLGFMFTQQKMWARKFWYRVTLATMYFSAGLIPWYITMLNLGLTNNFLAYILPAIVSPFHIILVKTYIENTPIALQEAAEIDGAHVLRIYAQIILPICVPIIATVAIFSAVGQWNSFQDSLILMTNQDLYPLQFTLFRYISQSSLLAQLIKSTGGGSSAMYSNLQTVQTPTSVRMTVSVVVVAPILIVYPFFQRFYIKGIMIGSIKG